MGRGREGDEEVGGILGRPWTWSCIPKEEMGHTHAYAHLFGTTSMKKCTYTISISIIIVTKQDGRVDNKTTQPSPPIVLLLRCF